MSDTSDRIVLVHGKPDVRGADTQQLLQIAVGLPVLLGITFVFRANAFAGALFWLFLVLGPIGVIVAAVIVLKPGPYQVIWGFHDQFIWRGVLRNDQHKVWSAETCLEHELPGGFLDTRFPRGALAVPRIDDDAVDLAFWPDRNTRADYRIQASDLRDPGEFDRLRALVRPLYAPGDVT